MGGGAWSNGSSANTPVPVHCGCSIWDRGGGYFCEQLAAKGYRMTAADFLPGGLRRLQLAGVAAAACLAEQLPFGDASFDAALALDVLEHVEDRTAARELARVIRPKGLLFVTVPAFAWLWSYRDEAAGHRRRYHRAMLEQLLAEAGFQVEQAGYYQFFLFPVTIASRWLGRRSRAARDLEDLPPAAINAAFRLVTRAEVTLGHRWPCGSSLVAVARKRF
ncbi:MAG: methyltransferase domain-containing protein [Bryobacteraceae bacterium]